MSSGPTTLFDKLWRQHLVCEPAPGVGLLYVDRHYIHDLQSTVFGEIDHRGLAVRRPDLTVAVADHAVSSAPGRTGGAHDWTEVHVTRLREGARRLGIGHLGANDEDQGIIHVIGPELGLTLPGMLVACGDSHTTTHGALGALALGIGTTEIVHVLATQTLMLRRPRTMRIHVGGQLRPGVEAKDLILHLIGRLGAAAGVGCSVEFAGPAVRALDLDQRLTLCNLAVEMGAVHGMVAPDEVVFEFLHGRAHAPAGPAWDAAVQAWRGLRSDDDARFDHDLTFDASEVAPQITWGTSPQQVLDLNGRVPDPRVLPAAARDDARKALDYMGLQPGQPIAGTAVDRVFIGSCANARLGDLRRAAAVVRGRRVHPRVRAWVVPGSQAVKRQAQALGLDRIFLDAGFEWREPGCALCVAANGEQVAPGQRCVSTSNRNFVGRQGPGARTHLASPVVAAWSALLGAIPAQEVLADTVRRDDRSAP